MRPRRRDILQICRASTRKDNPAIAGPWSKHAVDHANPGAAFRVPAASSPFQEKFCAIRHCGVASDAFEMARTRLRREEQSMAKWKMAGINFDHMHMGDLLRGASIPTPRSPASSTPNRKRMDSAPSPTSAFPADRVFTDSRSLPDEDQARPRHRLLGDRPSMPTWSRRSRRTALNILVEKPFAGDARRRRRMIAAMQGTGQALAINWPLAWYPLAQHRQAADRRGRDRRPDRGAFLRRQSRPALPPRRQGRGLARRGRSGRSRAPGGTRRRAAAAACSTISATARRSAPGS